MDAVLSRRPIQFSESTRARSAYTMVELLVAMAIVALLIALVLPAIQSAREGARRTQCLANLRQLSLACSTYHAANGRFPGSSIGSGNAPTPRNISAHARLLPFVDQQSLFQKIDLSEDGSVSGDEPPTSHLNQGVLSQRVAIYECPSDSVLAGGTNYRVCTGTGPALHSTDRSQSGAALAGAFGVRGKRDSEFADGLSNTIFFSEKLVGDRDSAMYTPWRDFFYSKASFRLPGDAEVGCQLPASASNPPHGSFGGSAWLFSGPEHTWYNHVFPPNSISPDCGSRNSGSGSPGAFSARSAHAGGVNGALGDGSARLFSESIDLRVWRAFATIDGNDVALAD